MNSAANNSVSVAVKDPCEDEPTERDGDAEAKGRAHLLFPVLGAVTIAVFSLLVTWRLAAYATQSSHVHPLKAPQIAVVLAQCFFLMLWLAIHGFALASALTAPSFWKGFEHHRALLISDDHLKYVSAAAEFSLLLMYFFLCDRTDLLPREEKHFDQDQYWFIWLAICGASCLTIKRVATLPTTGHVLPLQRDQTEEWKGWMQLQFLMYHYFHATDYYNAIRCYIAAYVWMTGFGNFSFYYVKRDFGMQRFFGMQWRLNFFVFWCCLLLDNSYMLYYICMLHTTFTVFIYGALGVMSDLNYTAWGIRLKFLLLTALVVIIWNVPGVFEVLWFPLRPLLDYQGSIHEWAFRSKLDHLVWIPGMLSAFSHPTCDTLLERLDTQNLVLQYTVKAAVVVSCLAAGYVWYAHVFQLPKLEYNQLHPYTSFIPITLYIILRNVSSRLRQYHVGFLAWMGKITLETYICQFHIWMLTTGPNGNPKQLLRLLPKGWPLCNFALVSALYVLVAYRVFLITNTLKGAAIPAGKDSRERLLRNLVIWPLVGLGVYVLASLLTLLL